MSPKFVRGGERAAPKPGVIVQARPFELHGTRYYAIVFRFESDPEGGAREARLSHDMIYDDPQAGDEILIQSVLGIVDRVERRSPA